MFDRRTLAGMISTLTVEVPRQNAAAARDLLADTAEAERDRVLRAQATRSGTVPSFAQVVDGRRGADLRAVRPDGMILLEFGYVREIAARAAEELITAGPRDSGDWAQGLVVLVDGTGIDPGAEIPHMAQSVQLVATVPYARRLEIGRTRAGDPFILDDEDYRLIERTAKRLAPIYREVARVDFTYVGLEGAYQLSNRSARAGRGGGEVRYPALRIQGWQVV